MIPSIVASELQEAIRRFLYASFPMTTPGFRRDDGGTMLDDLLAEPEAIFKGLYLGLGLPFRRMEPGARLPFERSDLSFTPYRHQFRAFQRLCGPNPRSTLVATGTGSGKTECFSLPILDYCAGLPRFCTALRDHPAFWFPDTDAGIPNPMNAEMSAITRRLDFRPGRWFTAPISR